MSGFSAAWLALREPYDRRARNPAVLNALATEFAGRDSVAAVDLGCGTGATPRAVSALLPPRQDWLLVDRDTSLLAVAKAAVAAGGMSEHERRTADSALAAPACPPRHPQIGVVTLALDLAASLEAAVENGADLVTLSALLDLVSADWLDRLVAVLARRQLPLYAALSYDGRVTLAPPARHDDAVVAAVNRHQCTDKGFGPALGPAAAQLAPARLRSRGFAVVAGTSDWYFAAEDHDIQAAMLAGWAEAAAAMGVAAPLLAGWLEERRAHLAAGRATMRVGHVDFFASPMLRR